MSLDPYSGKKITEPSCNVEFFLLGTVKNEVNHLDLWFTARKQLI